MDRFGSQQLISCSYHGLPSRKLLKLKGQTDSLLNKALFTLQAPAPDFFRSKLTFDVKPEAFL